MAFDIDSALAYVVDREGSDLHLKVAAPPVARVHGDLWALQDAQPLTAEDTEHALKDAREIGQAATLMYTLVHAPFTYLQCGSYAKAKSDVDELVAGLGHDD